MATAPYGVRLLVGAATIAVEETIRLPKTILMYPMTLASTAAHVVMRFQQNVAELVIKGDATLEQIFPPKDEQPEWATFDEDLPADEDAGAAADTERRTEGRFALYSSPEAADDTWARSAAKPANKSASTPEVVEELDYEQLTLAQLRARLQSLDITELEALLAYEEATKGRAPFQTLLANRITRATAK
ncbi:lipid droplet-associated protein [Candidatus Mycobacterium wuenschmannii]|uniref:Lipid droplet-associated protein n=1 Tax=Candidatus Mycobacterium wuenschmannii TaxID=3027808 RepID=A0ABY8W2C3_9MYCO|nr:lipid droplet-associated protein [Candidatus Mycobacterium wuenschmannii]WIM90033.1 lipid droplet-associated protein [Candidatus Mycobacterium wuenschmannii]